MEAFRQLFKIEISLTIRQVCSSSPQHKSNQSNYKHSFFVSLPARSCMGAQSKCAWHKQWPGWMLCPSITLIAEKDTGKWNVSPSLVSSFDTIKGRQTAENPISSQHQSPALGAGGIESSLKLESVSTKQIVRGKQQNRSPHKGILSLLICRSHLSPTKATLQALLLEVLTFSATLSSKYKIGLKLQRWGASLKQRNHLHLSGAFKAQASQNSSRNTCSSKVLVSVKCLSGPNVLHLSEMWAVQDSDFDLNT